MSRCTGLEKSEPIMTWKVRLLKYDFSHCSAAPLMPVRDLSLSRRMAWSIVSKAALRSRRTISTPCYGPMQAMSFLIFRIAVSVYYVLICMHSDKD